MKMKRKISIRLLIASFIIVILACGIGAAGTIFGSVYVKTNGTSSDNLNHLFTSLLSGDGKSCLLYTDSYSRIAFDASGKTGVVFSLCDALCNSYSYELESGAAAGDSALSDTSQMKFSYLDLDRLEQDVAGRFEGYVYDVVKEYDTNVTTEDGKYLPEVYEKAYERAVTDALSQKESYYTSQSVKVKSVYDVEKSSWRTDISEKLAGMLRGGLPSVSRTDGLDIPETVDAFVEDSLAELTGEPVRERTAYSIPRDAAVAPKPDPSNYGSVSVKHADQVLNIVSYARSCGLLGEQDVIFNPKAKFYPEDIVYYCDDSILVICWKEYINGCVCNCMEVKLADGSQLRRKLTGDTYGSGKLDTVSNMSQATNAVAATSADYYAYRDIGATVYQKKLYRYDLSCEVLMIDDKGRFIFYYPDGKSEQQLKKFIKKKKIQFSLAFGPVLIDNYQPRSYQAGYAYNLGEMQECYSRAGFGEFDDLHYLFMTSGYSDQTVPPANLDAFIDILATKNLKNAYNVDGGQTAEIVFNNQPYNHIDYGGERQVSDMIYFATAIREKENE